MDKPGGHRDCYSVAFNNMKLSHSKFDSVVNCL